MNDANLNSIDHADEPKSNTPRVVIVGGGFGGLAAAKALRKAPVQVILIDRTNHHVFQPLPYQVATSAFANLANLARSVRDSLTARFRKSKRNKFFPRRTRLRTPFGMIEANATKASPIFWKIGKYRAMRPYESPTRSSGESFQTAQSRSEPTGLSDLGPDKFQMSEMCPFRSLIEMEQFKTMNTAMNNYPVAELSAVEVFPSANADCVGKMVAAAVLFQAAEDLQKFRHEAPAAGKMLYSEVRDWVTSNDRGEPGSFLNVCRALQLMPDRVRADLLADDSLPNAGVPI